MCAQKSFFIFEGATPVKYTSCKLSCRLHRQSSVALLMLTQVADGNCILGKQGPAVAVRMHGALLSQSSHFINLGFTLYFFASCSRGVLRPSQTIAKHKKESVNQVRDNINRHMRKAS